MGGASLLTLPVELRMDIYELTGSLHRPAEPCRCSCAACPWNPERPGQAKHYFHAAQEERAMLKNAGIVVNNTERGVLEWTLDYNDRHPLRKELLTRHAVQPALTQVCQLVRAETLDIFYGGHTFYFLMFDHFMHLMRLVEWLQLIGPGLRYLRRLVLVYKKKKAFKRARKGLHAQLKTFGVHVDREVLQFRLLKYPHYVRMCCANGSQLCDGSRA